MRRYLRYILAIVSLWTFSVVSLHNPASAESLEIIRDAETEGLLKDILSHLFKAAGLNPNTLELYILLDSDVNASVNLGNLMLVNTGFLLEAKDVGQIIGVLAHETGHIADGHVVRFSSHIQKESMKGLAIGALAATIGALSGSADMAMGGIAMGLTMGQSSILHYSRGHESAADQAALKILDRLGWSSKGFYEIINYFHGQSRQSGGGPIYLRTHPTTNERLEIIRAHMTQSPHTQNTYPAHYVERFKRVQAKLRAFIEKPAYVIAHTPENSKDFSNQYGLTVAHFKSGNIAHALSKLETLLKAEPKNPYLWELKGQIHFENGQLEKANNAYNKAVALHPHAPLIRLNLAHTIISMNTPGTMQVAIQQLNEVNVLAPKIPMTWRLLAIAHGRENNIGMTALCLAEKARLEQNLQEAEKQSHRAIRILNDTSKEALRAEDLIRELRYIKDNR